MLSRKMFVLLLAAGGVALFAAAACDEGDDGGGSGLDDGLPETDSDADTDGDSDGDADDCTEVAWGSGLTIDEPVANWTQTGYVDSNGDGVVEQEEVDFSLADVNCDGVDSIVLMIGSTT